jgi:hypothetical protein
MGVLKNMVSQLNPANWMQPIHSKMKPFFYNIAGRDYNLDELRHGLIRLN